MKKLLSLVAVICAMVVLGSCGEPASPSATIDKALTCIQNKDSKGYVALLKVDDSQKAMMESIADKAFKAADEKGGLKSWTIKSEEIAEDGQTAVVKADLIYGNDETAVESTYNLVLDNGEWKLKS
ncbi:MAG: DUF4878 domain-containing protein [Muribaculaceae bacterium]|nr:DUF4878 domain-containing protein [Muribaculaceae bacterium]MBR5437166.1 DUF4878 domain-containing protein [Muribaculaceae bacterium]MBR5744469.1 DUF4878 domain-containing protein [Muribaculaceae bacterium]